MSSPIVRPQASKQHGQTLAEFAISLPLVLLLLFGILEFGRMFQSWVTLQNAARTAVRYAVTGQYNEQKYDLDYLIPCYQTDQVMDASTYDSTRIVGGVQKIVKVNTWVPHDAFNKPPSQSYEDIAVTNPILLSDPKNNGFPRRVDQTYLGLPKNGKTPTIIERWDTISAKTIADLQAASIATVRVVALNPDESLYATWYGHDGIEDCTPNDDTLQYRKDMVRLASIYDEARRGAAGLALDLPLTGDGSLTSFQKFLYSFWSNPSPIQERDGWFNVMICSARGRMYSTNDSVITGNPDDGFSLSGDPDIVKQATGRFHTFRGPGQANLGNPGEAYVGGACILKERPAVTPSSTMANNYNVPWADAGSAGERVTIIITYNHPLITPLGLARYVRMQASRSAVNEAFKIVNAERATGGGGNGTGDIFATNTPTPSFTPVKSATPTDIPTVQLTSTNTPIPTKTPFLCSKLLATDVEFSGSNTIYVKLENDNLDDTTYLRSDIAWNSNRMKTTSPDAYAGFVSIENQVNWTGYQDKANSSPVSTNAPSQGDAFLIDDPASSTDVVSPGVYVTVPANGSSRWQLTFIGLTKPIYQVMDLWELGSTKIYLKNPDGGECAIGLTGSAVLTPTPSPVGQNPTATFTPDCADLKYSVAFKEFMPNGDVHLQVTSKSLTQMGYFIGFSIKWADAKTAVPNLKFVRMTIGGRNANDYPSPTNPNGTGVVVWESATGGATTPPTTVTNASPEWKQDYIFPPAASASTPKVTDIYLDFSGVGADTLSVRGVPASAFNTSTLRISCNPNGTGGNGTGGTSGSGDITFDQQVPPTPAGPPTPTLTPAPTLPPTLTFTPGPTLTFSPIPPTATKSPNTAVPPPSWTPTPVPTSTPNIKSCTDNCGF